MMPPRVSRPLFATIAVAGLTLATAALVGAGDDGDPEAEGEAVPAAPDPSAASEARLRSFSAAQRRALLAKLTEFDALPADDQARIRALDARLGALPEEERANYLAVLHRYHVWLAGLTDGQRAQVEGAGPDERMAVIARIRAEGQTKASPPPMLLLAADFAGFSPFDLANRIKVYLALDPAQKADVNRLQEPERSRRLQDLARQLRIDPIPRLSLEQESKAFEGFRKSAFFPLLRRPEELLTKGRIKQRLSESAFFSENPPERVKPANLLRFAEALPVWVRTLVDPMPPEEARRRLSVLYRLIYPAPAEMPVPAPAAPPATPRPPAPPKAPGAPSAPF